MAKREIGEEALKRLLDNYGESKAREAKEREYAQVRAKLLSFSRKIINGWGATAFFVGGACLMAAPELIAGGWAFCGVAGNILAAAGNVLVTAGAAGTARVVFDEWAENREGKEKLLLAEKSVVDIPDNEELILELEEED